MDNPEEILHSLEEFTKYRPRDIPRDLEDYLSFVAKTGDTVYQWPMIKGLFREKLINVVTEFYEACPAIEIPPCPNVELFNYDNMKSFILEKLDSFVAAPFTIQRICELLTSPRKEYNRIDKYMRALEKNILVVSTTEPGRRNTENGDSIVNGLETDHLPETSNVHDINVDEMDDSPVWPKTIETETEEFQNNEVELPNDVQETFVSESTAAVPAACSSSQDTVCQTIELPFFRIEKVETEQEPMEIDISETVTSAPAGLQNRRSSIEPVVSTENNGEVTESSALNTNVQNDVDPLSETNSDDTATPSSDFLKTADSTTISNANLESETNNEQVNEITVNQASNVSNEEDVISESSDAENLVTESLVSEHRENQDFDLEEETQNEANITENGAEANALETDENQDDRSSSHSEDVNLADTTKDCETQTQVGDSSEEGKDEEITSSDKVQRCSVSDSEDNGSGHEAEAKVQEENFASADELNVEVAAAAESESVVSASSDDEIKDCDNQLDAEDVDEKEINEAEATTESS